MKASFSFNRPLSLLVLLPLLMLAFMLVYGMLQQFQWMSLVMLTFTSLMIGAILYFGFLRRVSFTSTSVVWKAPGSRIELPLSQIRHFGIVKYRSFRFIYVSRQEEKPFQEADARIVTTADTIVLQFRQAAWKILNENMQAAQPNLEASSYIRN